MQITILMIQDDRTLSCLLGEELERQGYQVFLAGDGVEGMQRFREHPPDLVLLDIALSRMDGWEVCRRIRELSDVPIIMLSSSANEMDIVRGLELGADGYVTKPFGLKELVARIRATLRRRSYSTAPRHIVQVDERLAVDRARGQVLVDGQAVDLSAIEFNLLSCFLDNAGRILTHQSLLTQVWGWEYAEETDYLKVYVHLLRKKIEPDPKHPCYILTKRGLGYRLDTDRQVTRRMKAPLPQSR